MTDDETAQRQSIIDACLEMAALGINQGTSGNVSLRHGDGLLITPTRIPYGELCPDDIVAMTLDGRASGRRRPSSEWRFHCDIMRARPEVAAIVHAHPVHATAVSILELGIPPLHYMVAVAGGKDVRCAPYALFGSQELSDAAIAALDGRRACLLAHHGLIAVGSSLSRALHVASEVEVLARQHLACLAVGGPKLLSDAQMDEVLARFADYDRVA